MEPRNLTWNIQRMLRALENHKNRACVPFCVPMVQGIVQRRVSALEISRREQVRTLALMKRVLADGAAFARFVYGDPRHGASALQRAVSVLCFETHLLLDGSGAVTRTALRARLAALRKESGVTERIWLTRNLSHEMSVLVKKAGLVHCKVPAPAAFVARKLLPRAARLQWRQATLPFAAPLHKQDPLLSEAMGPDTEPALVEIVPPGNVLQSILEDLW